MKSPDHHHIMQRVKVGMIGLAAVILLIAIASTILGSLNRDEPPVVAAGAAQSNMVADMTVANAATPSSNEPLAELGVAPAPVNTQAPAEPAR
jgi:cobalamin synthase